MALLSQIYIMCIVNKGIVQSIQKVLNNKDNNKNKNYNNNNWTILKTAITTLLAVKKFFSFFKIHIREDVTAMHEN